MGSAMLSSFTAEPALYGSPDVWKERAAWPAAAGIPSLLAAAASRGSLGWLGCLRPATQLLQTFLSNAAGPSQGAPVMGVAGGALSE